MTDDEKIGGVVVFAPLWNKSKPEYLRQIVNLLSSASYNFADDAGGEWGHGYAQVAESACNILCTMCNFPVDPSMHIMHSIPIPTTGYGDREMARYALRMETADGTLEDAYHFMACKADAIRAAKNAAKNTSCADVVRFHVDDTKTEIGVFAVEVKR